VLSDLPPQTDPRVLVDFRTADDAGVYRWEGGPALVQTVDFFTPIVDDPFTYGQIAAANSLSDIYAMGGRPVTALAIAGFPDKVLDESTIRQVFLGGYDKLREAGVALLGGHTVRDPEVKFGYAVTGAVDADRIWTNGGAEVGDVLVLTKRLGTGIIGTAIKFERASAELAAAAIASMTRLNKSASTVLSATGRRVHACTDVTGFGVIGHATEMAQASGVTVVLDAQALPMFEGVLGIAAANRSGGMESNRDHFAGRLDAKGIESSVLDVCFDPQTSGGLLVALAPEVVSQAVAALEAGGDLAAVVGEIRAPGDVAVRVR
jgi:selenide,water dikinase